jgi:hypothetical protein
VNVHATNPPGGRVGHSGIMRKFHLEMALTFAIAKGLLIAGVLTIFAASIAFIDQLIIAIVSASIGGIGVIGAAWIATREGARNRDAIEETHQAVREVKEVVDLQTNHLDQHEQ